MKKFKIITLMLCLIFIMTACGNDKTKTNENVGEDVVVEEKEVILEYDPLPELWHGEWVCVYSEARYFNEDETIFIKDFDNAVLYTNDRFGEEYEDNRWFFYDEENKTIDIYNEPPPFIKDGWIRESFEIKKESEAEIVMTQKERGHEVRFEKVN